MCMLTMPPNGFAVGRGGGKWGGGGLLIRLNNIDLFLPDKIAIVLIKLNSFTGFFLGI